MDKALQNLLSRAEQENNVDVLHEVHKKLTRGRNNTNTQTDPFNSNHYVTCAEIALKLNEHVISSSCLKLYFEKTPPNNEFLCRAYLCQAQLNAPQSSKEQDKFEQCVGYLMKAINFAKTNKSYHYLVYNASVLYWSMVRPFLKPNHKHVLAKSLQIVVKSLDEIDEEDREWRSYLMISLIECHIDAGNKDEAIQVSNSAMQFTKQHIPHVSKEIFALQVMQKLIDVAKINSTTKGSMELSIFYRILKLKSSSKDPPMIDSQSELERILRAITDDDEFEEITSRASSASKNAKPLLPLTNKQRNNLLMELSRLCLELGYPAIGNKAISEFKEASSTLALEGEFIKAELKVAKLKDDSYSKSNIELRIQAVQSLHENLMTAYRLSLEHLMQIGCVTLWNLCLPLLQINLRSKISKYLIFIAEILEEIDSLLLLLRCQIHIEVSKCEEDKDQLQSAILHLIKASKLDDTGCYKGRLEHTLHRLKLKSLLYQVPARVEDHARMIIEQAESSRDATTSEKMCVYLAKAGNLLSPDAFDFAMDGEKYFKTLRGEKSIAKLEDKVERYQKGISKIAGHVIHLEGTNDRERLQLWADLVKTARKQNVWDVTRTAARFCLLYDNEKWQQKNVAEVLTSPSKTVDSRMSTNTNNSQNSNGLPLYNENGAVLKYQQLDGMTRFTDDTDTLCLLAEVNFLYAEALVQLLHTESLKLLESPALPIDTKLRPKKYADQMHKGKESIGWITYCDWIKDISNEAIKQFQRAAKIGCDLNQSWIVCNASIYIWNYTKHFLIEGNYSLLVSHFQPFFAALRAVGHDTEVNLLCDMANVIAKGYMQPHLPNFSVSQLSKLKEDSTIGTSSNDRKSKQGIKSQQHASNTKVKGGAASVLSMDAVSDLKQALEVLEYVLNATSNVKDLSSSMRHPLIKSWVLCKALLNQPVPKNYQIEKEENGSGVSKALCAAEVLFLKSKDILEITPAPILSEVVLLINNATWSSNITLLEIWSQLADVSLLSKDYINSMKCADTAIEIGKKSLKKKISDKKKGAASHVYTVEQELLHYANLAKAQCLVAQMNGRAEVRRKALECFVQSCVHAKHALNYDLVLNAAKHFWKVIYPIVAVPIERQLLQNHLIIILECIATVDKVNMVASKSPTKPATNSSSASPKKTAPSTVSNKNEVGINESYDKDLKLRAALFGLLFQTYSDKGDLVNGLEAMNKALTVMPRTHHRLLIFKHRIITNAKLNKPFQFDMGKFRDEGESLLSQMWFKVAKYAINNEDKMSAYVNSIQVLSEMDNIYQKVDYLAEFGEWLFINEYPLKRSVDQLEYAISLLLNHNGNCVNQSESEESFTNHASSHDSSALEKINDIRQIDVLIRIYTMLARITDKCKESYRHYLLSAAYLVQRMWKVSLLNAERALNDGLKPGERSTSKTAHKKGSRDQVKTEKSTSRISFPTTFESLAIFHIPDKLREYYVADQHGIYISKKSVEKPLLTLHYLRELHESLSTMGFHHLCVYIIVVMDTIVSDILKDSSLCLLIHLISCDLYEKLNMVAAYEYHQDFVKKFVLSTEDLAKCREEIALWKDKQLQVKKEEQRQNNSVKFVTSSYDNSSTTKQQIGDSIVLREVWVECSEYLINQSQYHLARVLLEEASLSAVAFEDQKTSIRIDYCYALISFHEGDWGKVIAFLQSNESYPEEQLFWIKKLLLLSNSLHCFSKQDTTFMNHLPDAGFINCRSVIENAIVYSNSLTANNSRKFLDCNYIISCLYDQLGTLLYDKSKESQYSSDGTLRGQLLVESCDYLLRSYNQLDELGHKYKSFKVMLKYIDIQKELATSNNDYSTTERKEFLMKIYNLSKTNLLDILKESSYITSTSCSLEEMMNLYLPIQRDIIDCKVSYVHVMMEIIYIALEEKRAHRIAEDKKEYITKLIDEYVDIKEKQSDFEETWKLIVNTITEEACMFAVSVTQDAQKVPALQAKALLCYGKLITLLARYENADWLDPWKPLTTCAETSQSVSNSTELQSHAEVYSSLHSQSTHCLLQALDIALAQGYNDIIVACTQELIQISGLRDPVTTLQLVALHQSAAVSLSMNKLLQRVFIDNHVSRSASLMYQNNLLKSLNINECLNHAYLLNQQYLNEQEWYRRTSISKNHFDFVKEIPFNITYIILQHSPDKKYLYGGVIDKNSAVLQSSTQKKKDGDKELTTNPRQIICNRISVDGVVLNSLVEMCREFKVLLSNELMRQTQLSNQKEKNDEAFGRSSPGELIPPNDKDPLNAENDQIQFEFDTLLLAIEAYMGDLIKDLGSTLLHEEHEMVVMLCDEHLLELPLEALSIFQTAGIKSLSRDFSLQTFYHRFKQGESAETGRQSKADQKTVSSKGKHDGKLGGKGADKNNSSVSGKQKAGGNKEFVVDKDNILLDISNLKYMIDPMNDGRSDDYVIEKALEELLTLQKTKLSKWTGTKGSEGRCDTKELQQCMNTSPALLYCGYERFLSVIPADLVAPLNLNECFFGMILDLVETIESSSRQSSLDSFKSPKDVLLETPVHTSMILSLCGMASLTMNQWNTTVRNNSEKMVKIFTRFSDPTVKIGNVIRSLITFPKPLVMEVEKASKPSHANKRTSRNENAKSPVNDKTEIALYDGESCSGDTKASYDQFNLVMYGLPNFVTSL